MVIAAIVVDYDLVDAVCLYQPRRELLSVATVPKRLDECAHPRPFDVAATVLAWRRRI